MVYSAYEPESITSLFTVRINNIYLRAGGGGQSVVSTDKSLEVKSIGVSEDVLNRGGIYVDTGTTDTYLWNALQPNFVATFLEISGFDYDNEPTEMTEEQLAMRPTILLQLAGNVTRNSRLIDTQPDIKGLAKELDVSRPLDILVAIPPENYYEFNPETGKYTARIYFDDSRDDIIGANSLIGHDVLFQGGDAGLGWAESDCNYTELIESRKKSSEPATNEPKDNVTSPSEKRCGRGCGFGVFLLVSCFMGLFAFQVVRYRNSKNAALSNELELRAVDNDAQFT